MLLSLLLPLLLLLLLLLLPLPQDMYKGAAGSVLEFDMYHAEPLLPLSDEAIIQRILQTYLVRGHCCLLLLNSCVAGCPAHVITDKVGIQRMLQAFLVCVSRDLHCTCHKVFWYLPVFGARCYWLNCALLQCRKQYLTMQRSLHV